MDHSGLIPRYEVAPVTDAEWAEALKEYVIINPSLDRTFQIC